jgi:hypothetical protein
VVLSGNQIRAPLFTAMDSTESLIVRTLPSSAHFCSDAAELLEDDEGTRSALLPSDRAYCFPSV